MFSQSFLRPTNLALDALQIIPNGLAELLRDLGWKDLDSWWSAWQKRGGLQLARSAWPAGIQDEWLLGIAFPLLSQVEDLLNKSGRNLLGLSALPGCGKTTLCDWLVQASADLGWSIAFLSIDDFYWPGEELDRSMLGNPWGVPRALPGSHDLTLMAATLDQWRETGELHAPRFDKSLRQGRGDRSGWVRSTPDLVIFEGWFVGVHNFATELSCETASSHAMCPEELAYRQNLVELLPDYAPIWARIDRLWHLRAPSGASSRLWKRQQVAAQEHSTGVHIPESDVQNFVRMIETALPSSWMRNLHQSNVVIDLTKLRVVREITLK